MIGLALNGVRNRSTIFGHCVLANCPETLFKYRTRRPISDLKSAISSQINAAGPGHVWVPTDFAHLGSRDAIDKTLQRMVLAGDLRCIDRGLYDKPSINRLTQRPTTPEYRAIVDAIARRDQLRMLVDGMTAANDRGLTDAVPAGVTLHTDARRRAIKLDKLVVDFKQTAPVVFIGLIVPPCENCRPYIG
jgi:hypothetical protein